MFPLGRVGKRLRRGPTARPGSTPPSARLQAHQGGDWGLVSLPVFKTGGAGDPGPAGSIPVRLRWIKGSALPAWFARAWASTPSGMRQSLWTAAGDRLHRGGQNPHQGRAVRVAASAGMTQEADDDETYQAVGDAGWARLRQGEPGSLVGATTRDRRSSLSTAPHRSGTPGSPATGRWRE